LRWVIGRYIKTPPRAIVEACLLTSAYQLLFMDNTEAYAVLNESVRIAKKAASEKDGHFVNAVLRNIQRELDDIKERIPRLPDPVRLSHPESLLTRWENQYGREMAISLCEWNNQPAFVTIHPVLERISFKDYLQQLRKAGIAAQPHPFLPDQFIQLPHGHKIHDLPGYAEGLFTVQDPATYMAVDLLKPLPGEVILDACSAPGGKAMLMAERMKNSGQLIAMDLHVDRLALLTENIKRMNYDFITPAHGNAARLDESEVVKQWVKDGFDAILVDVPCSNTGVIRRRPDARWRFSKTRQKKLLKTQVQILYSASQNLRTGGRIVYSTCSLEPEENLDQINRWLENNLDFMMEEHRLLLPPESQTDGAFAALLRSRT